MAKTVLRIVLAIFYFAAGIAHLRSPAGFIAITPDWVPFPQHVVLLTGIAEIVGAIGLFIPRFRKAAGVGLALYAVCVWPANFNHALNDIMISGTDLGWGYHGPRLAFQPVFIWLALWVGEVTDWPFRKRH
ncbi:DoxX family protein [Sphingorhabdus sp.]|uniref:DoxX family protein n=1 Tax=Sphingorhabdus sp. TaxID=1902408 RepID=UPI00359433F0